MSDVQQVLRRSDVSVLIPTFNCARYICDALESVFSQTLPPQEVIVVDDGSTDNTPVILESYMDRIRYFYQKNSGASAARNTGIRLAKSPLIAFLDADDLWMPDHLELSVKGLEENPLADMVFSDALFNSSGVLAPSRIRDRNRGFRRWMAKHGDGKSALFKGWMQRELVRKHPGFSTSGVVVRKDCLLKVGGFDETFSVGEDCDLWVRISFQSPLIFINRPTYIYRMRPGSLTRPEDRSLMEERHAGEIEHQRDKAPRDMVPWLSRRIVRTYFSAGYYSLLAQKAGRGRLMFIKSLRYNPLYLRSWIFFGLSFLPSSWIKVARGFKRLLAGPIKIFRR